MGLHLSLRQVGRRSVFGARLRFLLLGCRSLNNLQCDASDASADHLKCFSRATGNVDDAAGYERAAIIDADDDRLARTDSGDANAGPERQ
jgi:hypothetical protein